MFSIVSAVTATGRLTSALTFNEALQYNLLVLLRMGLADDGEQIASR